MFSGLDISTINNIKKRLKSELQDKELPYHRKEEVNSLLYYINEWLRTKKLTKKEVIR